MAVESPRLALDDHPGVGRERGAHARRVEPELRREPREVDPVLDRVSVVIRRDRGDGPFAQRRERLGCDRPTTDDLGPPVRDEPVEQRDRADAVSARERDDVVGSRPRLRGDDALGERQCQPGRSIGRTPSRCEVEHGRTRDGGPAGR